MKRYIVAEQGVVQLDASRRFVVEVPDAVSEQEAKELVEELHAEISEKVSMEWILDDDQRLIGYDVRTEEIEVYDPVTVRGGPEDTEGFVVIKLDEYSTEAKGAWGIN